MDHYTGMDVSPEQSSVCVVDAQGKIVKEAKVVSESSALISFFEALVSSVKQIGLEAGPLSQWLHAGLMEAGFKTVLLETRQVKAALSAMTVKTDRLEELTRFRETSYDDTRRKLRVVVGGPTAFAGQWRRRSLICRCYRIVAHGTLPVVPEYGDAGHRVSNRVVERRGR